jgi:hypothetical protein
MITEPIMFFDVYELYDLHWIFVLIRNFPEYELNKEIISRVVDVLKVKSNTRNSNEIRTALSSIPNLDEEKYKFVFVQNVYTYHPTGFIKNQYVIKTLIKCCINLLKVIEEGNQEKIRDLADCLHNLPTLITHNNITIPKNIWKNEVRWYRKKWDKDFLKEEEKQKSKYGED